MKELTDWVTERGDAYFEISYDSQVGFYEIVLNDSANKQSYYVSHEDFDKAVKAVLKKAT